MAFPTTSVLDTFTQADGPLSANWTAGVDASQIAAPTVVSNAAKGGTNGGPNEAYWNVATFGADCECYLTLANTANGEDVQVYARVTSPGASSSGYSVLYRPSTTFIRIRRIDSGAYTSLSADTTISILGDGDKIGIECVGSTITAYKYTGGAWSSVVNVTDATYSAAGYIGMALTNSGSGAGGDNFGGGTISGGGAGSRPMFRGS